MLVRSTAIFATDCTNCYELELPRPDVNLEVGSGSHAQQTALIMQRFEPVLLDYKPAISD